jgi:hypothetical protein
MEQGAKHMRNRLLDEVLKFDPIDAAEQLVGRDGDGAVGLGLLLAQGHGELKAQMLTERDDTLFSNTVERYLRIAHARGFETVLCIPFQGNAYNDAPAPEELLYVLAHRDGLLLVFDTFHTTNVNGAKVHYNWRPHGTVNDAYHLTSSGGWHNYDADTQTGTWVGDHDAREALCYRLDRLRDAGDFLNPWAKTPWLWLLHYMDTKVKGYDYAEINATRIRLLPQWVRDMITP